MSYKLELSIQWFPSAFPRLFQPLERGKEAQGPPRLGSEPEAEAAKSPVSWPLAGILGVQGAGEACDRDLVLAVTELAQRTAGLSANPPLQHKPYLYRGFPGLNERASTSVPPQEKESGAPERCICSHQQ